MFSYQTSFKDFVSHWEKYYALSEFITKGAHFVNIFITSLSVMGKILWLFVTPECIILQTFKIYTWTQPEGPFKKSNFAAHTIKQLIEPLSGNGHNMKTWSVNRGKHLIFPKQEELRTVFKVICLTAQYKFAFLWPTQKQTGAFDIQSS